MRQVSQIIKTLLLISVLLLASCSGVPLVVNTLDSVPEEETPLYTLIYFVGIERYDVRRAVILDVEGDGYEFKPAVEDFEYEILQGISMGEALYETNVFFTREGVKGYVKSAIMSPGGEVTGYEFRPQYYKDFMGVEDLLKMSYSLDEASGKISIDISLRASLKRLVY